VVEISEADGIQSLNRIRLVEFRGNTTFGMKSRVDEDWMKSGGQIR
jgi:hypothetical protein